MKIILNFLVMILLTSNAALAWFEYVPKSIDNWNDSLLVKEQQLIDLVYDEIAWNYFVGDDGEECEGWIEEISLNNLSQDSTRFSINIEAQLEEKFYCIWQYPLICQANFTLKDEVSDNFPYNWTVDCDFRFYLR